MLNALSSVLRGYIEEIGRVWTGDCKRHLKHLLDYYIPNINYNKEISAESVIVKRNISPKK